jgi:hypothetical protein
MSSQPLRPFPQSYWVRDGLVCAGHYPGDLDEHACDKKLTGLLECGILRVVNLIPSHEKGAGGRPFAPYAPALAALAKSRGLTIEFQHFGFADGSVPEPALMVEILDYLDSSIAAGQPLYLHCWGGHGRTGTVVGCHLIRHGAQPQAAIEQICMLRQSMPKNHDPFENGQEAFVLSWKKGA